MDHSTAKKLIKATFEAKFDRDRFRRFTLDLLNDFEETPSTTYKGNTIPRAYEPYVRIMDRLGKYEDQDGNLIDVLIVHLKKESSLERARTTQRNLIGWYLNGSRGGVLKDGALVAFVSPDPQDWRFSFVKMDYEIVEKEGGGVKAEQTFTPARRFSFLVGENEYSHTAQKQLIPILEKDSEKPSFQELEEGFSVEPVTERFYEEYRDRFLELKDELDKLVEKDDTIREDFKNHNVDTSDFAKKLMGQIVFLYFLQKKGWFGVARDGDWGSGPKNFLRELFEKKHATYSNFFNDILEPLFYEALATQRPDDYYSRFNCKIPFLNGGLFDPIQNYNWINTDLLLPDTLFSNSDDTGILDVFDRYNFTIKENEPLEKEVAVDPEMLGKVFENLLEVEDRKSKGTYYTPREIVHYMCQESLIQFLETEIGSSVPSKDIKTFVRYGEQAIENDMYVEEQDQETRRYSYDIPESIRKNAEAIDEELASIRVCDPAVGSGAFLVGMMNEIVRKREVLTSYHPHVSKRNAYKFKLDAIHDSLYGVDIEPGAVEIAKLRLWLSLVVEEENIKRVHSLPNLDYKIMQGNSLLEEYEGIKLIDERFFAKPDSNEHVVEQLQEQEKKIQREYIKLHQEGKLTSNKEKELQKQLKQIPKKIKQYKKQEETGFVSDLFGSDQARKKAEELLELQEEFFDASRQQEKHKIRNQIEHLTWDLIELTLIEQDKKDKLGKIRKLREKRIYPFFLWHLNFAEVFQKDGGFDVVIGNPPYIKIQNIENSLSKIFKKKYRTAKGKYDIYVLFIELAYYLTKDYGTAAYIHPTRFIKAGYGEATRGFLKETRFLNKVINFESNQVFSEATTYTGVHIYKSDNDSIDYSVPNKVTLDDLDFTSIEYSFLGKKWHLTDDENELEILKKIRSYPPLREVLDGIYQGVIPMGDDLQIFEGEVEGEYFNGFSEALSKNIKLEKEIVKPLLKGEHIRRYQQPSPKLFIFYPHYINDKGKTKPFDEKEMKELFPLGYKYIENFKEELIKKRKKYKTNPDYWFGLHRCRDLKIFKQKKIITPQLQNSPNFTIDTQNLVTDAGGYSLIIKNQDSFGYYYYLGILNSKLLYYFIKATSTPYRGNYYYFKTKYLEPFGVPINLRNGIKQKIISLSQSIYQEKNVGKETADLERKLDIIVCKIYGLEYKEFKTIAPEYTLSKGEYENFELN